jgi:hypothetical protein
MATITAGVAYLASNNTSAFNAVDGRPVYVYINNLSEDENAGTTFAMGHYEPYLFNSASGANFFMGWQSGRSVTSGEGNLGIGPGALGALVDADNNLAVGWDSQKFNQHSANNVTVGEDAGKNIGTSGTTFVGNNAYFGYTAGYTNDTGIRNAGLGPLALYNNLTGSHNVAIGYAALYENLASENTVVGVDALRNTVNGQNTVVGRSAGNTSTTGTRLVLIGYGAGYYETGDDKLFIDNRVRSDEADARVKALIYGVFAATTAAQSLAVNAALSVLHPITLSNGLVGTPSYSWTSEPTTGWYYQGAGEVRFARLGVDLFRFASGSIGLHASANISWGSTGVTAADTTIERDGAADTLALKRGTNAQTFNHYGTNITDGSRYSRLAIKHAVTTLASVSGASVTATSLIPAKANVLGVNTIVSVALGTGSGTTGYTVGDGSDVDRWGAITGTVAGTDTDQTNATADPTGWFNAANNVVITATGGNFDGTGSIVVDVAYTMTEAA